jgi:alpha-amylase
VLTKKWGPERTERERDEIAAFLRSTGLDATPASVMIKWLTDWVRAYGIDGYRVDTAKHVELAVWNVLAREGQRALDDWRAANPDRHLRSDAPFWVVGEVFGAGVERTDYFDSGFDAVINFAYKHNLYRALEAGGGDLSAAVLDSLYASIAERLHPDPTFNALHYVSSHDTDLFRRSALMEAGTALLLAPGAVQIYYGDETARPPGPPSSDPDAHTRSPMNWSDLEAGASPNEALRVLRHWQTLGQFRQRHPAVGLGAHETLAVPAEGEAKPYVFVRRHRLPGGREDVVMVALVPEALRGRPIMLPTSRAFADDALVRDAATGQVALVSYGQVRLIAGETGIVLLEEAAE